MRVEYGLLFLLRGSLLLSDRRRGRGVRGQQAGERGSIRRPQPAAGVPARSGLVADVLVAAERHLVIAGGDIVEAAGEGVDLRVDEAHPALLELVYARDQAGPQGRHG